MSEEGRLREAYLEAGLAIVRADRKGEQRPAWAVAVVDQYLAAQKDSVERWYAHRQDAHRQDAHRQDED